MKELFTGIQNRLAAEVPSLQYVDEDWGQLDMHGSMPPVRFPCALIDCSGITVSHTAGGVMLDDVTVAVRIADMRISNTSHKAPMFQKEKAFALFDLMDRVTRALHGWTGNQELYGRLRRTGQSRQARRDGLRVYEITFHCAMRNTAAQRAPVHAGSYTPVVTGLRLAAPPAINH